MNAQSQKTSIFFTIIGACLLYLSYRNESFEHLQKSMPQIHFKWIILASISHLINHAIRSYRWSLLLATQQAYPPFHHIYLAEMTGFFFNGIPGRLGEIGRCQSLARMYGTPIRHSLATVIVERVIDILFFMLFFVLSTVCYHTFIKSIASYIIDDMKNYLYSNVRMIVVIVYILTLITFWFTSNAQKMIPNIHKFTRELWYAIKVTRKVNATALWISTSLTLLFYFLLEYMCLFSLDATANLIKQYGFAPAVCVFIALNLSHLIPTGHGAGLYQILAVFALGIFGLPQNDALLYATITYAIQLFNSFVIGGICMLFSFQFNKLVRK